MVLSKIAVVRESTQTYDEVAAQAAWCAGRARNSLVNDLKAHETPLELFSWGVGS